MCVSQSCCMHSGMARGGRHGRHMLLHCRILPRQYSAILHAGVHYFSIFSLYQLCCLRLVRVEILKVELQTLAKVHVEELLEVILGGSRKSRVLTVPHGGGIHHNYRGYDSVETVLPYYEGGTLQASQSVHLCVVPRYDRD